MAKYLCFALLAILACPAKATEMDCQALPDPEIIISPSYEEPRFDHSMPMSALKAASLSQEALTDDQRAFRENSRMRVGGLTAQRPSVKNSITINLRTDSHGTACAQITKIKVDVAITNSIVHVAKEFPEASCSYQVVLGHELKHVEMARRFLYEVLPVAKDYVRHFVARYGAVRVESDPSGEKAKEIVTWSLNQYLNGYTSDLLKTFASQSARIDTPEEYRRVSESCNGETQRVFNSVYGNPR